MSYGCGGGPGQKMLRPTDLNRKYWCQWLAPQGEKCVLDCTTHFFPSHTLIPEAQTAGTVSLSKHPHEFGESNWTSVCFPVGVHKRKRFCTPICLRASQGLHSCCFGSRNYAPCCTLTLPSSRLASETLVFICMERGLEHPIFTHGAYKHTTRTPRCSNTHVCTLTIQGLTFCLQGHPRYHPGAADGDLWRWWLSQRSHGDSLWGARQKSSHQYAKKT